MWSGLIHQANYLLDRQIRGLEQQFIKEGGYSERLAAARLEERKRLQAPRSDQSDRTDRSEKTPACSVCGKAMVLRAARKGPRAGSQFWGCSGYPECTATEKTT
ncbi:MAG: topoisomerase DNA-binding C4 zinc finger domain-containing protein [Nitrospirae bacterium]|nr:topoisomerase DNA-binding C4 zinc finger domain-containing protein [Nitrospirota bacterium]